jgi:glycopeptide antibiotics resistance protein
VCIAEVGQYFLPSRSMDIQDVFWGVLGAGIGLFFVYIVWRSIKVLKDN